MKSHVQRRQALCYTVRNVLIIKSDLGSDVETHPSRLDHFMKMRKFSLLLITQGRAEAIDSVIVSVEGRWPIAPIGP